MASGHMNRVKRPDTWLHRPMLQNVKKVLANPEPSTHGTKRTCQRSTAMSAIRVILLQKSFWGDKRNFLEPLMRFASGDVRDHIVSSKIDQGPPWWP